MLKYVFLKTSSLVILLTALFMFLFRVESYIYMSIVFLTISHFMFWREIIARNSIIEELCTELILGGWKYKEKVEGAPTIASEKNE